jgi:deazaflavin-dependent oxidoreductase (nitroreductase family)
LQVEIGFVFVEGEGESRLPALIQSFLHRRGELMNQINQGFRQKVINLVRVFNKHILNRMILALAETGKGPYTVVYHVGRRSGKVYSTPVFAYYNGETIIVPLPYGENVDWLRNVLAKGNCEIVGNRSKMTAANLEILESAAALPLLPRWRGKVFQIFKIEKFLRLKAIEKKGIRNNQ